VVQFSQSLLAANFTIQSDHKNMYRVGVGVVVRGTGWRRPIGCLKLQAMFLQKSHKFQGSCSKNDI